MSLSNVTQPIDLAPTLAFLSEIQQHNTRDWFEQNRSVYDQARAPFASLANQIITDFRSVEDWGNITAKDCVMRLYRDVRFSKDKSPYRTNFGAVFAVGGKKSGRMPYYLQIEPGDRSFLAGGMYSPTAEQLAKFRVAIDRNAKPFKALINAKSFREQFGGVEGEKLKTAPQGYDRHHPEIGLLNFKQVIVRRALSDRELLDVTLPERIVDLFVGMKPLLDYLNQVTAI